jgi:hypothetical protein
MTMLKGGAAALALAAACLAASPAAAADDKAPGVFLQCDGRVGHVSDGARFMRLLLVSATAGLSEAAMSRDGADKRVKGTAGVFACDEALAKEGDAYRRMQLALARPLHLGEDKKWDEAAVAAAQVPQYFGAGASDWGLTKSATSTARYLQTLYLVRAGKLDQAETAAWDGVRAAGLDVLTLQRMSRFIGISRTISPEKRAALQAMQRYYPDSAMRIAAAYGEAGDFKSAIAAVRGLERGFSAFLKDPKPVTTIHSVVAAFSAMDGDVAGAKSELAIAKTALEQDRSEGEAASNPTVFAAGEEAYAFAEAAIAAASGDTAQAGKLLAARGSWPTIAPGVVAILVGRVAPKLPEKERLGVLAKGEEGLWKEALDARVAVIKNSEHDDRLWSLTAVLEQDEGFRKLARNALSGAGKSKWLLKPGKEPRDFDILVAGTEASGWEGGEGILYHAALMAKARGKQGFVLLPKRDRMDWVGLRFVDSGELGIPPSSMIVADDVIVALSPHIVAGQN